ncbi:MAG: ABC transporter ATP-binding protein [Clostridiales bacterium]|nr:ABC transporter ATP-binding protein [Eubacteriales bacterium]MDH7566183.1 ABC transporter ATP-binding protein [Clostridiales bacterium]
MIKEKVMDVEGLCVSLLHRQREISVVRDVSFCLEEGKVLGLIGESGCGKSITCLSLLGLLEKDRWKVEGSVRLKGKELPYLNREKIRRLRGSSVAMVMQNPISSFNPLLTVGQHFTETIRTHKEVTRREAGQIAVEMLLKLNLSEPEKVMGQYPFQLSGGMLQRVMIAIALFMCPHVLIADEPTTSLDVTVQYQILKELAELRDHYRTAMLLVSHDLGVIAQMADEVAVMYGGYVVEQAPSREIFCNPMHPYTRGLMKSRPAFTKDRLNVLEGYPPSLMKRSRGCPFYERCRCARKDCLEFDMKETGATGGHSVRCLLYAGEEEVKMDACS